MKYEDFYDEEYDYFDSTIADLKEQLKKEVKQEIQDKIATLEKENAELQDVKENWEQIKQEYKNKINEIQREKQYILDNAKRETYNATLKDLFDNCDYFQKLYKVDYKTEEQEKCDKCDENRELTIEDCYGRKHKVHCKCSDKRKVYYSEENLDICVYIQKEKERDNFRFEFRSNSSWEYGHKINKENVLEKFDKDKVKGYYWTYFTTLEEAQKYADYLNNIED